MYHILMLSAAFPAPLCVEGSSANDNDLSRPPSLVEGFRSKAILTAQANHLSLQCMDPMKHASSRPDMIDCLPSD